MGWRVSRFCNCLLHPPPQKNSSFEKSVNLGKDRAFLSKICDTHPVFSERLCPGKGYELAEALTPIALPYKGEHEALAACNIRFCSISDINGWGSTQGLAHVA